MRISEIWGMAPEARQESMITGEGFRLTVLTSRLIRLQYAPDNRFWDGATMQVVNRRFPAVSFQVREAQERLELETEALTLSYDRKPFSPSGLFVTLKDPVGPYTAIWSYGDTPRTLGGTARTLDEADGPIEMGEGLVSEGGFALLDDTHSMGMDPDGRLLPRDAAGTDLYLFAYGHDFSGCIRDFLQLSGPVPPLPRFALGNWWSRFYPYTQAEYLELMDTFRARGIPLSVAVLDMNWHITDIPSRDGTGWTGYTFDREKFPQPEALMRELHQRGLKVTLNDHPADGVRPFEEAYPRMAREMGDDPADGRSYPYDAASERFKQAFEKAVLEPLEDMGVDFWWIDWQQQGGTTDRRMDPLLVLNHTRYLHALRTGRTPLILSRYGGPGSHRYPVGFSGDTFATWASLAFQPEFTATAANAAYPWWSHDIGGHMHGSHDPELTLRWIQFGVFSPIMRLHSSDNRFMHKEPWMFEDGFGKTMSEFLRVRHRLIPYLYTENLRCSETRSMMLRPLYFEEPENQMLYHAFRHQYYFGSAFLVAPVTSPLDPVTRCAPVDVYLPEGGWTDYFTHWRYEGGRSLRVYRPLDRIPVFVPDGTILPMNQDDIVNNSVENPEAILFRIYPGKPATYTLMEDNGLAPSDEGYRRAQTRVFFDGSDLVIDEPKGDRSILPEKRHACVEIIGVEYEEPCSSDGMMHMRYDTERHVLAMEFASGRTDPIRVHWKNPLKRIRANRVRLMTELLDRAYMSLDLKMTLQRMMEARTDDMALLAELARMDLPGKLFEAMLEILTTV